MLWKVIGLLTVMTTSLKMTSVKMSCMKISDVGCPNSRVQLWPCLIFLSLFWDILDASSVPGGIHQLHQHITWPSSG